MSDDIKILNTMVRSAYDLQKLRIQSGLRLCANFRAKLKAVEGDLETEEGELSEEAKKIITQLKERYRRLTDGVAKNRRLPEEKNFRGDPVISTYVELVLVDQYLGVEKQEGVHFRQLETILTKIPIYTEYLMHERGIGPAMAGVLISYLNPHEARHVSSFWKYGGLDVAPDGYARSRREEHLVEREYVDKNGEIKTRMGVTFNPFLRTKLLGVLSTSFLRSGSRWRSAYDGYKHRLESDPAREKCTVGEWKKRRAAGEDVKPLWPPGRIHNAASRYMVKQFLAEYWAKWRALEGLSSERSICGSEARPATACGLANRQEQSKDH